MPKSERCPFSIDYLWSVLDFSPETGEFRRKPRPDRLTRWNARFANRVAGYIAADGYRRISLDGKMLLEHRLAIYMIQGLWPETVDHINGVKDDNRICNLRPATASQNLWNQKSARRSRSGIKGVSPAKGKWRARIFHGGKETHLGTFETAAEAKRAFDAQAILLRGEYFRP